MQNWISDNWGNLASVAGFVISVWALVRTKTVRREVLLAESRMKRRYESLLIHQRLEECISLADGIIQSRTQHWPWRQTQQFQRALSYIQHASILSTSEAKRIRSAVAKLSCPVKNDEWAQRWIGELRTILLAACAKASHEHQEPGI